MWGFIVPEIIWNRLHDFIDHDINDLNFVHGGDTPSLIDFQESDNVENETITFMTQNGHVDVLFVFRDEVRNRMWIVTSEWD